MNNKVLILIAISFLGSCGGTTNQMGTMTSNTAPNSNSNLTARRSNETSMIAHSGERPSMPNQTNSNSSPVTPSENSPMAKAIDVSEMTRGIENAEKASKAKPGDAKLKDVLAEAYFTRAFALTEAAQYRAALGDFRKGLKLKPDAKEAKQMHDQIIDIFKSIGREPPVEGTEPAPLPFEKKS